ncbi:MAG: HAD family hydrolase [Chlorobiaceae bacterium]
MNCKALIFDLDGTLLDTLQDIANTLNTVLARHGYPVHTLEGCRLLVGRGMKELVRSAIPEYARSPQTVELLLGDLLDYYASNWNIHTRPYPGICELLDAIEAKGIKMAILSNKADHFTRLCAGFQLSKWRFDVVMGQHGAIPPKPDPEGALMVARQLGLEPSEILYIGDSGIDMETATRSGMFPLGVLWGFRPKSELLEFGAKKVVDRPEEIIALLD